MAPSSTTRGRIIAQSVLILLFSVALAFLIGKVSGAYAGAQDVIIISGLLASIIVLMAYLLLYKNIEAYLWRRSFLRKARKPTIGILNQPACPRRATEFSPEDWRDTFQADFRVELISTDKISSKYFMIVNPYGEVYPEDDPIELLTLQRIKQYVNEGGIFTCAGGYAFWYGFVPPTGRDVPLAREMLDSIYRIERHTVNGRAEDWVVPSGRMTIGAFSLVDTPLNHFFRVVTTYGDARRVSVGQNENDRRYVGDLIMVGGTDAVMEFRAVREPTPNAIPFLRTNEAQEFYVMAGIPYGRGLLVLCGMQLASHQREGNVDIDRAGFEKIVAALRNFTDNIRRGNISPPWTIPARRP